MVSSVPLTMFGNGERCRRFVFRINVLVCHFATSQKPRITDRQTICASLCAISEHPTICQPSKWTESLMISEINLA